MTKVGIIGGAGYTAGELIRILLFHPQVEIAFVHSESNPGRHLWEVHQGIFGDTDLMFTDKVCLKDIDVLFLCSGHGKSKAFWNGRTVPENLKIIDLAQDFRDESEGYVYGLPEWRKESILSASKVANPGCFATAIQLALLPLAVSGRLGGDIALTAITGSTGAGVKPGATTHFSWRNDNISTYKVFEHQHLIEINRNLSLAGGDGFCIGFTPMRGDFSRGIFANAVVNAGGMTQEDAQLLFKEYYDGAAFTFVSDCPVDLKDVVNTNKAMIHIEKHGEKLVISSVIDNLLKGASGQAVQNMNLMSGFDEKAGLNLKASAF